MASVPKVAASVAPRFIDCASSIIKAQFPADVTYDGANVGRAGHEAIEEYSHGRAFDLGKIADKHDVPHKDVEILFSWSRRQWDDKLAQLFPGQQTEVELESEIMIGRSDLVSYGADHANIHDWKFGRSMRNAVYQMGMYAHGLRNKMGCMPSSGKIQTTVGWVRLAKLVVKHWDSDELNDFEKHIVGQHKYVGKRWGPGDACTFCPNQNECGARADYMRSLVLTFVDAEIATATLQDLAELHADVKRIARLCEQFDKALKSRLEAEGECTDSSGTEFSMVDTKKDVLVPGKAYPVLREHFGVKNNEFAALTSIAKGELEVMIKAQAERGDKGKRWIDCLEKLRAAGAINQTVGRKIQVTKGEK